MGGPVPLRALVCAALLAATCTQPAAATTPIDVVVRRALADYPTIRGAQSQRNVAGFQVEEAKSLHLPEVNIGASGKVSGTAITTPLPRMRLNIYAGGSIEAEVEQRTLLEEAAAYNEAAVRDTVAFNASQAYLRVLRAYRLVEVQQRSAARHEKLVADFEAISRIDQGRRSDLVQASARLELVRSLLNDRLADLASAQQVLRRYYPDPLEPAQLTLPDPKAGASGLPAPPPLDDNPSVVAARRDLLSAEAQARVLRLRKLPRLDFEAVGGKEALSQVLLSWRAFDPTLSAAERAAVAAVLGSESLLRETELQVLENRRQAMQDFESANRKFMQAQTQNRYDRELVDMFYEQFRVGRRPLLDLLTAFGELANSETNVEGSRVDRTLASYRYQLAVGRLADEFDGGAGRPAGTLPPGSGTSGAPADAPAAAPTVASPTAAPTAPPSAPLAPPAAAPR